MVSGQTDACLSTNTCTSLEILYNILQLPPGLMCMQGEIWAIHELINDKLGGFDLSLL